MFRSKMSAPMISNCPPGNCCYSLFFVFESFSLRNVMSFAPGSVVPRTWGCSGASNVSAGARRTTSTSMDGPPTATWSARATLRLFAVDRSQTAFSGSKMVVYLWWSYSGTAMIVLSISCSGGGPLALNVFRI